MFEAACGFTYLVKQFSSYRLGAVTISFGDLNRFTLAANLTLFSTTLGDIKTNVSICTKTT